ncbi:hypothetical protein VCRA2117O376_80003 [Vibrio crassostreae]|nr:hypothetical protein VCRA2119O381_1730002 [Vibrio crassostreae]CAK2029627.1 hypothetical protein VCRA2117O379_310003 [Vibrio crassostreae]CAK2030274.1 hypothetical protein VCRA2119O382_310006 [Vibrio crassostreae]CAK2032980.1 hypothetical protein VCRA2117O380_310003 [Vibrio crassostreae]CAK2212305.1 hypothetical protein VCRA2117O376_80003 [Vibrio crassostreae]
MSTLFFHQMNVKVVVHPKAERNRSALVCYSILLKGFSID